MAGRYHTDVLLNNICEVFNRQIVDAREKPIIACLEYIREYLMKRIVNVQHVIERSEEPQTPTATKTLNKIEEEARNYQVMWNGEDKYQVSGPWNDQQVVDVCAKICSCRRWELTGMPCKHVVVVNYNMKDNVLAVGLPKTWVNEVYWINTWKEMYRFKVEPITGRLNSSKSNCPTSLLPPEHHKQIGRPKKKRKKGVDEMLDTSMKGKKLTRSGQTVTCSKCKKTGHNSRTCIV